MPLQEAAIARILVPVGGTNADGVAVRLACDIARSHKAKIYALYVIEVGRALPLDADLQPETQRGEQILSAAEERAEEFDYELETAMLQAREVGPAIVDEAVERGADLIVMGTPYQRQFGEFSLGQTAPYILKNAPCRVYLCRLPDSESNL